MKNRLNLNSPFARFLIIAVSITVVVSLVSVYFVQQMIEQERQDVFHRFSNSVSLVSNGVSNKIESSVSVITLTAQAPVVKNIDYANLIDEKLKGIPESADTPKREFAKTLLRTYPDFEFITFHMPNGDFYLMEPFSDQLNVTRLNFADRDWYGGVMSTMDTYTSEVYESTTLKRNVVAIRAPVFDDGGKFIGIWGGSLDLKFLEDVTKTLILEKNVQISFYDQYGKTIFNTADDVEGQSEFVKLALGDKADTIVYEPKKLLLSYSPIKIGKQNWALVVTQPYDDAFFMEKTMIYSLTMMIITFAVVISFASYLIYRMVNKNIHLAEQLEKKDTAKEEFSAMVTHELKTPLFPILGYCKMFKSAMFGKLNPEQEAAVDVIEKNANALQKLVTDIMDARKLDLGHMKFLFNDVYLSNFFVSLSSSYKEVLREKGVEFVTKHSFDDDVIYADDSRLKQVFDNLISNSIKFVPEKGGRIEVGGYAKDNNVVLYVKDNGTGIPPEKQKELFKKFYQIDTSERRSPGGTGLGLAISKGIVDRMHGTIWVESDGKTGSTFYFSLPQK